MTEATSTVTTAERSVLGAILIDPEPMPEAAAMLRPDDFFDKRHMEIFGSFCRLANRDEPIDMVTVYAELKEWGATPTTLDLLPELSNEVPTSANAGHYAKIVVEASRRRDVIKLLQRTLQMATNEGIKTGDVIDAVASGLGDLAEKRAPAHPVAVAELVREEMKDLETRNKGQVPGIPTGFDALDKIQCGMNPGDLIVIAARPSMGKTALALNMADYMAIRLNLSVLIFTLEMEKLQLVQRLLATRSEVSASRIRTGDIHDAEWSSLANAAGILHTDKIHLCDQGVSTVEDVRVVSRAFAARHPCDAIIVDYMQLLTGRGESREQDVSGMSRGLKNLAKELRCPVIALSQLNRSVETRPDKRPRLSDLRESGAIEQDADSVMFIYRDDYYNPQTNEPGVAEIAVAKNRHGPVGMAKLDWHAPSTRFKN